MRCIKPNEIKSSEAFDVEKVKNQVFYLGLLENVRVRRAGFASRLTYEKFLLRHVDQSCCLVIPCIYMHVFH